MKQDDYYLEIYLPPIMALIIAFILVYFNALELLKKPEGIILKITDISFIIFGFLLTILAILLQSSRKFKQRKIFDRMVNLNKKFVWLSLILGVFSLFYGSSYETLPGKIKPYLSGIFFFNLSWLLIECVNYISVFYRFVLTEKEK